MQDALPDQFFSVHERPVRAVQIAEQQFIITGYDLGMQTRDDPRFEREIHSRSSSNLKGNGIDLNLASVLSRSVTAHQIPLLIDQPL